MCLPAGTAVDLGLYLRDVKRWVELVTVCLDGLESPAAPRTRVPPAAELRQADRGGAILWEVPRNPKWDLDALLVRLRRYGGTADVVVRTCYQDNAWYDPQLNRVVLCADWFRRLEGTYLVGTLADEFPAYILAHEYAHALIEAHAVPYTGSEEAAADEFANAVLPSAGHPWALYAAWKLWTTRARPEDPTDPHLGDLRRASNAACHLLGAAPDKAPKTDLDRAICTLEHLRARSAWTRLLSR